MQRVFRSSLIGLLGIASLTACGDKVPTGNTSDVTAVTVAPATVPLNVGDKITLVATVTAGAGVTDRTVTWSSSNPAVATVNATTGEVTAVGGGTTTVIATSVANPAIKGAATVTVGAVVQPTVTIVGLTQKNISADLSNIAGQLDVTLNVDAGTQKLSKVELLVNCGGADTVVYTQTVGLGDVAPLAADASASTIVASFHTESFNATNGTVAFKNGPCTLKARGTTSAGVIVASSGTAFTLNNIDFVSATMTTPNNATDAGGLVWHGGAVTVAAVPVFYSAGATITSATVTLINDDSSNTATKVTVGSVPMLGAVATLTGLTPTAGVITATFPKNTTTSGVDSTTVKLLGVQVTTVTSTGNPGPTLNATPANVIRLDNLPPDKNQPAYVSTTQNSTNGWVGKNFVFSKDSGAITLGTASTDNNGVDKVTFTTQSAPDGSSTWTTFTAVTGLAETSTSSGAGSYKLRLVVCDALNNCTNTPSLGNFGVDLTPPSLAQTGGPNNLDVFNIGTGAPSNATFDVGDTSNTTGVTPSGGRDKVQVSLQQLKPSGTSSATVCAIPASTSACTKPDTIDKTAVPTVGAVVAGEYTMVVSALDQAGNASAPLTIKYYVDPSAPVLAGGVAVPAAIGAGTAFASTATDDMDIAAGNGFLDYNAGAQKFLETGTATPTGVTFDNTLVRSAAVTVNLTTFYRSLQTAIDGAGVKPDFARIRAIDAAGNLSLTNQNVSLPSANITTATDAVLSTGASGISSFVVASSLATVDSLNKVTTLKATAAPITATSGSPFNQMCFYFASPTGAEGSSAGPSGAAAGELVLISCTNAISVSGSGATRLFNYSISWTPSRAALATNSVNVFAVGGTSGGSGLLSGAVAVQINP